MQGRDYLVLAALFGAGAWYAGRQSRKTLPPASSSPPAVAAESTTVPAASGATAAEPAPTDSAIAATTADSVQLSVRTMPAPPARDLAAIQERIRESSQGTYLQYMLEQNEHRIDRWPDRRLEPLRVWIQATSDFPDWSPSYPVVAERAFAQWQQAGFPIQFDRVPDSTGADIQIVYVEKMPPGDDERRIGVANVFRDSDNWIRKARVTIAIRDHEGRPLSPETVGGTARHEIGHVLGLNHSNNPVDVMYPESRSSVISAADRMTLRVLYLLPPGPVR